MDEPGSKPMTTLQAKIAAPQDLNLIELGEVVKFFDSPDAKDVELYEQHGGSIMEKHVRLEWREHGKGMDLPRAKAIIDCGCVETKDNKVTRREDESLEDCVSRAISVLLDDGTAQNQVQAVAIANEMCAKCVKAEDDTTKGPEEFAAWVATNRDAIEGAWMMGMAVFVSVPASADREFVEGIIVELQDLLTDEYQVRVETEAQPPENEDWEQIKGIHVGGDGDKDKSLTPYQKWLDAVGIIGKDGEQAPFTKKVLDFTGVRSDDLLLIGATFKVDASEDIREDEPDTPIIRLARDLAAILERQEAAVTEAIEATKAAKPKKSKKATRRLKITNAQIKRIDEILRSFDAEIRDVMRPFAEAMVLEGGNAGIVRLQDIEAVSTAPGVEAGFDVTNPEVSKFLDTYAIELADQVQDQSSAQISQALKAGQAEGESTAQLTKRVQETGRFTPAQAERIARTESARAFVQGQEESWKQSGVVLGKRWLLAAGACVICQAVAAKFNSTVGGIKLGEPGFSVGDTFDDAAGNPVKVGFQDILGPPAHPNCAPGGTVIEGNAVTGMRMSYSGQILKIKTRGGNTLSVTPNHPVATPAGFVAACELSKGDQLFSHNCTVPASDPDFLSFKVGRFTPPDIQYPPTTIDKAFQTILKMAIPVQSLRRFGFEFHGDAKFGNGNIDIVSLNRKLRLDPREQLVSHGHDFRFKAPDGTAPLAGHALIMNGGVGLAKPVSRHSTQSVLIGAKSLRFGMTANLDAEIIKAGGKTSAADSGVFSYLEQRLPGSVSLDEIIEIGYDNFTGHVYDLQTISGVIVFDGIIVSNCRCDTVPVLEGE